MRALIRTWKAGDPQLLVALPALVYVALAMVFSAGLVLADTYFGVFWGQQVISSGLPHADSIGELTRGRDWVDQQWLAHVIEYGLWQLGHERALAVCAVIVNALVLLLACRLAYQQEAAPMRIAMWGSVCAAAIIPFANMRAQTFAALLFVCLCTIIMRDLAAPTRNAWWLAPLMIVWANVHGSVLLASVLLMAAAATWAMRKQLVRGGGYMLLALLAPLATPYGLSIISYYQSTLTNDTLRNVVTEWQPLIPTQLPLTALMIAGIGWAASQLPRMRNWNSFAWVLAAVLPVATISSIRYGLWMTIAAIWLVAPALTKRYPVRGNVPRYNQIITAALACLCLLAIGTLAFTAYSTTTIPTSSVQQAVKASEQGPLFVDNSIANKLMLMQPSLVGSLAIDGRLELLRGREAGEVMIGFFNPYQPENDTVHDRYALVMIDASLHDQLAREYERRDDRWDCKRTRHIVTCTPIRV